ncbi:MAG: SapC family protein [Caulobacteraceae bacterium]|nr:SapC family protein [Caulobacteraceae bacterium]
MELCQYPEARPSMAKLDAQTAGALRYDNSRRDYRPLAGAAAVPLLTTEFNAAARFYPIVFLGEKRTPAAVMGIQSSGNLYIDRGGGAILTGCYAPAFLRAWPFALNPDDSLTADLSSACFDGDLGDALFDGETPTKTYGDLVTFLKLRRAEQEATERICSLLGELELFEEKNAKVNLGEDRTTPAIATFWAVSNERMAQLDGAVLERLNRADALAPLYAHIASNQMWWPLVARAAKVN